MSYRPNFGPCPFCGRRSSTFIVNSTVKGADPNAIEDQASLTCACGVTMKAKTEQEHFEPVSGDLYRRVPQIRALDVLAEKWNHRAGIPSSGASRHLPPGEGGGGA